jgi:hypothetical protein
MVLENLLAVTSACQPANQYIAFYPVKLLLSSFPSQSLFAIYLF